MLKIQNQYASLATVRLADLEKFRRLVLEGESKQLCYCFPIGLLWSDIIGKEITPHDLRHFFCSHVKNDMSVHEVANQAGHSNIHTTLLYTNPTREKILTKMDRL